MPQFQPQEPLPPLSGNLLHRFRALLKSPAAVAAAELPPPPPPHRAEPAGPTPAPLHPPSPAAAAATKTAAQSLTSESRQQLLERRKFGPLEATRRALYLPASVSNLLKGWLTGWTPNSIPDLGGKVFLVTGGNSGMGFETCRALALNNAQVVLVSRNEAAGHAAAQRIRSEYGRAHVDVAQCDLGDVSSIVGLVDEIKRSRAYAERGIHCIVNMAGVYQPGPFETRMGGAVEHTLAVNYFGPALLTLLLLDLVLTAAKREAEGAGAEVARVAAAGGSIVGVGHPATTTAGTAATADGGGYDVGGPRILWMASQLEGAGALDLSNLRGVHYSDSGPVPYGTSKLFCLMFAQELQKRLDDYAAAHKCRRVDVFGVQPGLVASPLMVKTRSDIYPSAALTAAGAALGGQTPRRGAWSTLYAATAPELAGRGFRFYGPSAVLPLWHDVERKAQNRNAYRPAACLAVYESTLRILEELMQREAAAGAAAAAAADAAAASRKAAAAGIGPGSNVEALLKPLPSRIRHMYSGGLV